MTQPKCETCEHAWHGLPCRGHVYRYANNPYMTGPCPCRGPWATEPTTEDK